MEQHGENHRQKVFAIIPARLLSTRLAGKLLLEIGGKPLILYTLEQAKKARNIDEIIVATDDERILNIIRESGNNAVLTSTAHQSGSDRIAEVAENLPADSIIVNVQGDEPTIPPATIESAVEALLQDESADIATTCEQIEDYRDVLSPDVVKVVSDKNGFALYFSRSPVPFPRDAVKKHGTLENALQREPDLIALFRKHTGLYVYRREYLLKFTRLTQTNLEKTEMLEQLRALENGARIKVVEAKESAIGVDTREDFERVREIIEKRAPPTANIIFRKATAGDIPQVAKVHVRSWQESFQGVVPPEFLENSSVEKREKAFREGFFKKDYEMFVAETAEGEIVGFADFGNAREEFTGFDAELFAIYLLPEFQRKGVGGELFRIGARDLREKGRNSMFLEALMGSPYRAFYEKMGGKIIGESIHKLGAVDFETVYYGWEDLTKICRTGSD